ncbi:hypothetical protein PHAVU_009G261200, partial [Phaseolus vulgaris]
MGAQRVRAIQGKEKCISSPFVGGGRGRGRGRRRSSFVRDSGHRGGGHKRLYRQIDFRQNEKNIYSRIVTIEYDPNRNASICLIHYGDGEKKIYFTP